MCVAYSKMEIRTSKHDQPAQCQQSLVRAQTSHESVVNTLLGILKLKHDTVQSAVHTQTTPNCIFVDAEENIFRNGLGAQSARTST